MGDLISIRQAAAQGIDKLRMPQWVNPDDYLKIDIIDGRPGPWTHLFSPVNEEINGRNPVDMLVIHVGLDDEAYLPHAPKIL